MPLTCPQCGAQNPDNANACFACGASITGYAPMVQPYHHINQIQQPYGQPPSPYYGTGGKEQNTMNSGKKMTAALLAFFLGGFGAHKFYLGYNKEGIIQLVATIVTCGAAGIIPLIEFILYLTKSDEEFDRTYVNGRKGWF